jgi:hypothetical protein
MQMTSSTKAILAGSLRASLIVLIGSTSLIDLSLAGDTKDDQYESFVSWAVEYAIEQQKASEFQLTPYEEMNFYELRDLLEKPWRDKWQALRSQIDANRLGEEVWDQTIREDDETLLQLFRESLGNGHHREAWIYFSLLHNEDSLMAASREAYDVYIESYELEKTNMEVYGERVISIPYDCLSSAGSISSAQVHLTTEGAKETNPDLVRKLYAGPVAS